MAGGTVTLLEEKTEVAVNELDAEQKAEFNGPICRGRGRRGWFVRDHVWWFALVKSRVVVGALRP